MINEQMTQMVTVYMTDKPRVLGLFHFGHAIAQGAAAKRKHYGGLIMWVGPCKCGDPTHTFPRYYSMEPSLYVNLFGSFIALRLPWVVFDALQWFKGPPKV